jgi:hypothetical protein
MEKAIQKEIEEMIYGLKCSKTRKEMAITILLSIMLLVSALAFSYVLTMRDIPYWFVKLFNT